MSAASEIVRILRASGGKMSGRDIHARGDFRDLQDTLGILQRHSQPNGFLRRDKEGNSSTFVYEMKPGAQLPHDIADELDDASEQLGSSLEASLPVTPKATQPLPKATQSVPQTPAPAKPDRSGRRLHEHLFKTLEQLESGEIDHIQAKARATIADQIIKLANVQLLYEQLKLQKQIPAILSNKPVGVRSYAITHGEWYSIGRLQKIEPPAMPESVERDAEVTA